MPVFELQGPDGKVFEVDAPDAQQALAGFQSAMGQPPAPQEDQALLNELGGMTERPKVDERRLDVEDRAAQIRQHTPDRNIDIQASVPFSDEAMSALGAPRGLFNGRGMGEEYQRQMEAEELARKQVSEESPLLSGATRLGAGLATMGPGGSGIVRTGQGLGQIAPAATKVGQLAQQGLKAASIQGAKEGVAIGGATGLSEGQGTDRFKNAAWGGGIGGAIGGALPAVAAGVGGLVRAGKQVASPATGSIMNRIAPEDQAAGLLEEAFKRDNINVDDAAARLAQSQKVEPEMVLGDLGGSNVRGVARAARNTPGTGREQILNDLGERNLKQNERIEDTVAKVLKNPDDAGKTIDRLSAEKQYTSGPLYRKAFKEKQPVNVNGVVDYIDSIVKPGAQGVASPLDDLRPDSISATLGKLRTYFKTAKSQRVDLEELHLVKEEIDDMISAAKAKAEGTKARKLMGVKTRLLKSMDAASPDYRAAREIFSGMSSFKDAIETGGEFFKKNADAIKAELATLTASEREMYQIGVAKGVRAKLDSITDSHDTVKKLFGKKETRDALKAAFQNDQAFRKFEAQMIREAKMRALHEATTGNSTTAAQIADLVNMQGGPGQDVLSQLLDGKPLKAGMTAIRQALMGERGMNDKVADALAKMLMSKDPKHIQAALKVLQKKRAIAVRRRNRSGAASVFLGRQGAQGVGRLQGSQSEPRPKS